MPAKRTPDPARQLREALAPYLDLRKLRAIAAGGGDLQHAVHGERPGDLPEEVKMLLSVLSALLRPARRESIRGPQDVAGMLMVDMAGLEQEQLTVVLLTTKNQVIDIVTVYRGTINSAQVRVAEVFKEAIRRNAASIIVAHNHPSGSCEPSPDDQAVTRDLIEAGKLLGVEVLDHLVIGQGRWTSLRQRDLWH